MTSSNISKIIGIGTEIADGVITTVALIPIGIGFDTAGIVGGYIASRIPSATGNVVTGSLFAVCQF